MLTGLVPTCLGLTHSGLGHDLVLVRVMTLCRGVSTDYIALRQDIYLGPPTHTQLCIHESDVTSLTVSH